jgi:S-adenosylmethionine/arginine decarboxylase-like enzyme
MTATAGAAATTQPAGRLFGTELLLDMGGCDLAIITVPSRLAAYIQQLIKLIDMKAHGKPIFTEEFGEDDLVGWTVIQPIKTSNITVHAWPDAAGVLINIHSCRPFDTVAATEFTRKYFGVEPDMITANVVTRRVPRARN